MTKKLKQQALYESAVQSLKALGLTPGGFCTMVLASDICEFMSQPDIDDAPVDLEYTIEAFCGDNIAYETLELEVHDAWVLIEGHD